MPRTQAIASLAQSIGDGDVKSLLEQTDKLINNGLSADTLIASLTDHLRNLLILRTCGLKSNLVEVAGMSVEELNEQAQKFEATTLTQDIVVLEELRRTMRSSQAGRALIDAALVRLALAEQFVSVAELLDRADSGAAAPTQKKKSEPLTPSPQRGEGRGEGRSAANPSGAKTSSVASTSVAPGPRALAPHSNPLPSGESESDEDALPAVGKVWEDDAGPSLSEMLKAREASAEPAEAAVEPGESNVEAVSSSNLPDVWNRLIDALSQKGPSLPALLSGAKLVGIDSTHATLKYPRDHESVVRMLERNGKKDTIRDVLCGLISQNVGLKFEYDDARPPWPKRRQNRPRRRG